MIYDSGVTLVETWRAMERLVTTSTKPRRIDESFEISTLPEDAMREIRKRITTNVRLNTVVHTGVPGFIPGARS